MLVAEPTGGVAHVAHKGVLRARASTEGVSAHGSAPHLGRNAIYPGARGDALAELEFGVPPHPLLGEPTLNVGTISGGTAVNLVPDRAEAPSTSAPSRPDGRAALALLAEAAGPDVTLEAWIDLAPVVTDPRHPFDTSSSAGAALPYFTDAAALTPAYGDAPTVIWGPGEAAQAHQTDE